MTLREIEQLSRKHFPFPTPNPGQLEAIVSIVSNFLSGKTHVVVESPTGTGKSAIAITVHRVMDEIQNGFKSCIVTATKGLQSQYMETNPELVNMMGKENYSCPYNAGPYSSARCKQTQGMGTCFKALKCPYYLARKDWMESSLRLTNTSFQLSAPHAICAVREENRADLVVLDECHELDDQIVEHATINLTPEKFGSDSYFDVVKGIIREFINIFIDKGKGYAFVPDDEIIKEVTTISEVLHGMKSDLETIIKAKPKNCKIESTRLSLLEEFGDSISFLCGKGEWIINDIEHGESMVIKPVYPSEVSDYVVFSKADKFLHMSATICGYEDYIRSLGIEAESSVFIEVDNPIPVQQRKVIFLPKVRVSKNYDIDYIVKIIDTICDKYSGKNGVIHTVSFKLANEIIERSKHRKTMFVSNDKTEIMARMEKGNAILLSPSVEKGYDFKGDLARFQVVAKTPYLFLGDELIKYKARIDHEWYSRKAILRVVQASGRGVRGVNDYADTYIIDSNFEQLVKRYHEIFPIWFLESLKVVR